MDSRKGKVDITFPFRNGLFLWILISAVIVNKQVFVWCFDEPEPRLLRW